MRKLLVMGVLLIAIASCNNEPYYEDHLAALQENRDGWANLGITNYSFDYSFIGVDGAVTNESVTVVNRIPSPITTMSFEMMYDFIADKIEQRVYQLRVAYQEDLFYPEYIFYDIDRDNTNDQYSIYSQNFSTN